MLWRSIFVLFIGLVFSQSIRAAEYFVSPTSGNDSNAGTSESSALKSWDAVEKRLGPGDVVTLLPGTYPPISMTKSGTADAWITVRAKEPRQAIISLAAGWHDGSSKCVDLSNVAYVKIIGLKVVGCASTDHTIVDAQHGISINGCHHVLVQNCRVQDCSGSGIGGYDQYWDKTGLHHGVLDFITIEGNEVSGCAFWCKYLSSGISMCNAKDAGLGKDPSGYNFVIRNNICYGNENKIGEYTKDIKDVATATDGNGIIIDYFYPNNHYPLSVLVEGNLCFNNGGRGIHVFHSNNTTVRFNTCWHNNRNKLFGSWSQGELEADWADGYEAADNIAVANGDARWSAALCVHASTSPTTLISNQFFGPREIDSAVKLTESGTKTDAPLFVNASTNHATANFHLQPNSPSVHASELGQEIGAYGAQR